MIMSSASITGLSQLPEGVKKIVFGYLESFYYVFEFNPRSIYHRRLYRGEERPTRERVASRLVRMKGEDAIGDTLLRKQVGEYLSFVKAAAECDWYRSRNQDMVSIMLIHILESGQVSNSPLFTRDDKGLIQTVIRYSCQLKDSTSDSSVIERRWLEVIELPFMLTSIDAHSRLCEIADNTDLDSETRQRARRATFEIWSDPHMSSDWEGC
jgi:hypothetical protein